MMVTMMIPSDKDMGLGSRIAIRAYVASVLCAKG